MNVNAMSAGGMNGMTVAGMGMGSPIGMMSPMGTLVGLYSC
jgi:hypothetical protein